MVLIELLCLCLFPAEKNVLGATTNADKIMQIPTLGQAAMIGELYSAHSNQFIPGFSPWTHDEIEKTKHVLWDPHSSLSFGTDLSKEDKNKLFDVKATISEPFAAGLLVISGSAEYLTTSKDEEDTTQVTVTYKALTRTESISSNLTTMKDKINCTLPFEGEPIATHYVASVTFGGNCVFVFEMDVSDKEDKMTITGELELTINLIFLTVHAKVSLSHTDESKHVMNRVSFKVFSDFLLEKQPTTLNDTLKIYQQISTNLGSKDSLYNQAVPMSVVLMPLQTVCKKAGISVEIGKAILKRATDIRLNLMNVMDKISKLLTSRAAAGNFAVRELLEDFKADVQNYTLDYEHQLQTAIVGARNPRNKNTTEETLIQLVDSYTKSKYDYDSYLYNFLSEMTRQVNAINIFYSQTILQDEPQIAVFSQAVIPNALVSHQKLYVLTLNVLPSVIAEKFTSWKHKSQKEREDFETWYNNPQRVGPIGHIWRDFRAFFQLNKHETGLAFIVVLVEETKITPENIQIFVNGKEIETFELERLMAISPKIAVCRKSSEMTINVSNPMKMSAPNTILNLLVNLNSNSQNEPSVFNTPIDYTTPYTSLTIPKLVPEYTYNVTVAFTTEYGSLTTSKVFTRDGIFDNMMETVGCEILTNRIRINIQIMTYNTTISDCAYTCHSRQDCSDGWTFQLATGNCLMNIGESDSQEMDGWAIGTQSCGRTNPSEKVEDCSLDFQCCQMKRVTGMQGLDGTYSLAGEMDQKPHEVCADGCFYSKENSEDPEDLYCFKNVNNVNGLAACVNQN